LKKKKKRKKKKEKDPTLALSIGLTDFDNTGKAYRDAVVCSGRGVLTVQRGRCFEKTITFQ
jgi:hypothetical protein